MNKKSAKGDPDLEVVSLEKLSLASSKAITKVDGSGMLLYANRKAKNLLDPNAKDITGLHYEDFDWKMVDFQGNDYPPEDLPFKIVQETAEPVRGLKLALDWPDGERKFLSIDSTPLFDDQGNLEAALNLIEDITEAEKESNNRRARFEYLLRELSTRFLTRDSDEHGPIIEDGLKRIGKFLGVDRSYIFRFNWEQGEMSNIHEWCREGIEPQIDNLQDVPNSSLPALTKKLKNQENILIRSVSDLPKSWEAERRTFESQDIQSLLVVPISRGSDLFGFAGFDSVRRDREWGEKEVSLLRIFGNLVGAAFFRRRTERRIEESERRLELALEGGKLGIWDWNIKTNEVKYNERGAEMLGYDLEEIEPHLSTWEDMIHPDDLPGVREKLNEHLKGKTHSYEAEFRMQHKSGEWIWVLDQGRVVQRDSQGEPVRMAGTHMDITERKRAENELQQQQNLFESIMTLTPDLVYFKDDKHRFERVNKGYTDLFDLDEEEMIGKTAEDLWPEVEEIMEDERRALSGEPVTGRERKVTLPDGEKRWYSIYKFPRRDPDGNIIGFLGMDRDITRRKRTRTKLQRSQQELRQSFIELAETTSRVLGVRDPYTEQHEQRVADIAGEVGKRMGLDEDTVLGLYLGGMLHDIGKITVPETILTKPGELKDVEWEMIKSHPKVGYNQILADTDFPWPVAEMTLHHHERLDGSGYPDGLEGEELSLEVRILGAVDVVEAMSTRRPYREARSKERTLNVLEEGKGEKFDPEVIEILVEMIEKGEIEFEG